MLKLFKNLRVKDIFFLLISVGLIVFQVWLDLRMPEYMNTITRLVETEGSEMKDILINGGYMLLCSFGSLVAMIIVGYLISYVSANFSMNLRKKVFDKVESLSINEVKQFKVSSLITRTTNDITQIQMLIAMGLQMMIKAPITAVWAITKILNKSFEWSMLTGIALAILLISVAILMVILIPKFKIIQKMTDNVNNSIRENIVGIRVIRAFNAEKYQENKFNDINNDLTGLQLFTQRALAFMNPIMTIVLYTLNISIFFVGAYLIKGAMLSDKLTIFGNMIVFSTYAMQVIMSFLMLAITFMMLPRASVSAKRINEVLDEEITIKEGKLSNIKDLKETGTVEFKNVSFKYPDAEEYFLRDISFKANKGDTIAIIGSTGSGKSTVINLIPRFYDATDGEVLVDGINVKDYKFDLLNNIVGYVPQKAVMFDGSVNYNVSFGEAKDKITKEVIKDAVRVAQAKDFVEKMEEGYSSHIASGGTNVSGGQKQRLAMARAIARNPEIYIFDDSFSALDYKTDYNLRKELKKYTKDATNIIVAQRIGTILQADKIIVLDNGKCVGMGTHKELLKSCDVYKQIALSQLSKEELENA